MAVVAGCLFIFSLLAIISMFLRKFLHLSLKFPIRIKVSGNPNYYDHIWPYIKRKSAAVRSKIWHFILEAKDLKPATNKTIHTQVEKVKNAFRIRIRSSENDPHWLPEAAELSVGVDNKNPEDMYLAAIKKDPNDRSAYEALGRLYLQNKNYEDASEIYRFLIGLDPNKDVYYSNLGLSYYSIGEYKKSIVEYEKALNLNSKIPTRWINLALCFEALEDHTKAVKAIVQALELDRLNVNYMSMLADAYSMIPNRVRAEEVLEQILSLEPTNKSVREKLMRLRI